MNARPTWLVTGASGFLGANIGAYLDGRAHRIGVTRDGRIPSTFDEAVRGDLTSPGDLAAVIRDLRPDVVLHAAALASHEECEADPSRAELVNATATGLLAAAAHAADSRFAYISTDAVFDGQRGDYIETDQPNPTSVYGRTKMAGEQEALHATDALVIRTNFFGWSPSGKRSILEFFVNELSAGHRVRGFTDFTTTSAYVQVLAATIHDLVSASATGTFHATSPDALTKYEFGVAVAGAFALDSSLIAPTAANIHPPRKGDISLDVTKIQEFLGRPLPTQREGLDRARADAPTLRNVLAAASGA